MPSCLTLQDALVPAWRTTNRVTVFLIEHLPPELWAAVMSGTSLRTSSHTKVIIEARSSCSRANWGVAYLSGSRPASGNGRSVPRKGECSSVDG